MSIIGRVYKITSHLGDEVYVGSTIQQLSIRFSQHKSEFNNDKKEHTTSSYLFTKYGIHNCYIELIKEYKVIDRRHLEVYEALWIYKLKPINRKKSFGLFKDKRDRLEYNKQYQKDHKEEKNKYYEDNKERILEHNRQYQKQSIRCEVCDCEVRRGTMLRHERSLKHIDNLNRNN